MLDKRLLDLLVCPKCRGDLEYKEKDDLLICRHCGLAYPVKDDIPIMLVEEAKMYEEKENE
jgi:uncharacterized protein YbaR (Trm112 family)